MSDLELDAIKARAEAATAGPWMAGGTGRHEGTVFAGVMRLGRFFDQSGDDAEFIAHARSDIPALITEVERLRDELDRLRFASSNPEAMRP